MKTVSINLYSFDELSDEVKASLIENCRNARDPVFTQQEQDACDEVVENFKAGLRDNLYALDIEVLYDVDCGQGAGASFTCTFDINKLLACDNWRRTYGDFERTQCLIERGLIDLTARSVRQPSHYVHSLTVSCNIRCEMWDCQISADAKDEIDRLEAYLTIQTRSKSDGLYRELWKCLDALNSDEQISDNLRSNGEVYTQNGQTID